MREGCGVRRRAGGGEEAGTCYRRPDSTRLAGVPLNLFLQFQQISNGFVPQNMKKFKSLKRQEFHNK